MFQGDICPTVDLGEDRELVERAKELREYRTYVYRCGSDGVDVMLGELIDRIEALHALPGHTELAKELESLKPFLEAHHCSTDVIDRAIHALLRN